MILGSVPIKQYNHKYIDNSINRWVGIHFGDTSFNGNVVLGHRKPGFKGVHTMSTCAISDLRMYMKLIHASPRLDYYITANTVTGGKRRTENLFGLQNIVIDIDCHDDTIQPHAIQPLVEAFIWRFKHDLCEGDIIPSPNTIVRTGRGVQLWWAIKPVYGKRDISRYHYDKIKNNFIDHIEVLLEEYRDELEGVQIDSGASSNPVGYFRLPCTYNTVAKRYGSLEILHSERYDQRELTLIERPGIEAKKEIKEKTTVSRYVPLLDSDREVLEGYQKAGVRRVMQLIKLRSLRNYKMDEGYRNDFVFWVYNALRMSFDHTEAMKRLYAFNSGFEKPMSEREIDSSICSAKAKGGYKFTNITLIEKLKITPEEQLAIGLLPFRKGQASKPNASRDAVRKALKEDRDNKIIELVKSGVSQAETARRLGISKNTVGSVVKRLREEIDSEVYEEIEVVSGDENGRPKNGSIYDTDVKYSMHKYTSVSGTIRSLSRPTEALPVLTVEDSS